MATALLGAMGLSVGTYTSPNLSRVNERIARNGEPIDDDAFREVLETLARVEPLVGERLTRFERGFDPCLLFRVEPDWRQDGCLHGYCIAGAIHGVISGLR